MNLLNYCIFIFCLTAILSCSTSDEGTSSQASKVFVFGVEEPTVGGSSAIYTYDGSTSMFLSSDVGSTQVNKVNQIGTYNNILYFTVASNTFSTQHLYKYQGGVAAKVSDLFNYVYEWSFSKLGSDLYFIADEAISGQGALFKISADGEASEVDLSGFPEALYIVSLATDTIVFNGKLFITANNLDGQVDLYSFDGTNLESIDTILIEYRDFKIFDGKLYFIGNASSAPGVFSYDGTTIELIGGYYPLNLTVVGSLLYFENGSNYGNSSTLQSYDGSVISDHGFSGQDIYNLTSFDGYLYLDAYDLSTNSRTLFRYNGSTATRVSTSFYRIGEIQKNSNYLFFPAIVEPGDVGDGLEQEMFVIPSGSTVPEQITDFEVKDALSNGDHLF